jgi:hypothetical protein
LTCLGLKRKGGQHSQTIQEEQPGYSLSSSQSRPVDRACTIFSAKPLSPSHSPFILRRFLHLPLSTIKQLVFGHNNNQKENHNIQISSFFYDSLAVLEEDPVSERSIDSLISTSLCFNKSLVGFRSLSRSFERVLDTIFHEPYTSSTKQTTNTSSQPHSVWLINST